MRVSFCRLTDTSGVEIIINPHAVRYLASGGGGTTRVCFDSVHAVNVRGSPRQVQQKLTDEIEIWAPAGAPEGERDIRLK